MINRRQALGLGAGLGASVAFGGRHVIGLEPSLEPFRRDLLVVNAKVLTLNPEQPEAESILIRRGRIVFVGAGVEGRARGRGVPSYDAAGGTVIPGFIDGHTHLEWFSESFSFHTPLSADLRSLQDMFAILRGVAEKTPAGHWVLGRGTFGVDHQVAEKRMPSRLELDAISNRHPVILFSSVHEASLNTLAFKALGLWSEQDQLALKWKDGRPRVGSLVYRDEAGIPTGLTTEIYDLILDRSLYPFADRMAAYAIHAREDYVPKGLTTIVNMSGQPDHISADRTAQRQGNLPLRIRMFHIVPNADTLDRMTENKLRRGDGDDAYRFAGVKVFVDGDGEDGMGHAMADLKWTQEQLDRLVVRCNLEGYPVVFHVVSKAGFDLALNSIANAAHRAPRNLRHQIHHLGVLLADPVDRARVKALRVTLGLTRADRGGDYPEEIDYRGLLDEGIQPLCVSDSAGSFRHFSTLEGIASLVAPPSEGGVLPAGRTVTFDEALRMWTTTSAYANYEEHSMGSVSVGKLGDLAILTSDPRTLKGGELFGVNVHAVVLGGRVVFERKST
jgi:predicted amidohydrolase YtcJ